MKLRVRLGGIALLAAALLASPPRALAHCDTLDGPVVKDARAALELRDVTGVLKWVKAEKEAEVREAFRHALAVRALGPEARALADRFLFETLVRVHREGEGAPYTGLKPAGAEIDPGIAASDEALDTGAIDVLVRMVSERAEHGLRERFVRAAEAKRHAGESVEKGRAYVAAYVEFVHYAERLLQSATTRAAHAEPEGAAAHSPAERHRH
jgi:hypothetical protein